VAGATRRVGEALVVMLPAPTLPYVPAWAATMAEDSQRPRGATARGARRLPADRLPLRVCFLVPHLILGGGEVQLLTLCQHLDADKFQVAVVSLDELSASERQLVAATGGSLEGALRRSCTVRQAPAGSTPSQRVEYAVSGLQELDPDLVVFHGTATAVEVLRQLQPRPAVVQVCHTELEHFSGEVYQAARELVDRLVAVQESIGLALVGRYGAPPARTAVIPNGVAPRRVGRGFDPEAADDVWAEPGRPRLGVTMVAGIGDTIMLTAALAGLRRKYPLAQLAAYVADFTVPVLRGNPNVDEVVGVNPRLGEGDVQRQHEAGHDLWINATYVPMEFHRTDRYPVARRAAAARRQQYGPLVAHFPYTARPLLEWRQPVPQIMAELLGLHCSWRDMSVQVEPAEAQFAARLPAPYVVVHDWAASAREGGRVKRWFPEAWAEVTRTLRDRGHEVYQVGHEGEEPIPGATSLLGQTTFHETAAVVARAVAVVTVDSMVGHLAAAVGTPAVVLFGATPAALLGHPCHTNLQAEGACEPCWWVTAEWRVRCVRGRNYACMRAITPDRVLQSVRSLMDVPASTGHPRHGPG
jgi:ADP-heptose:LPS heptosyltransferase